MRSRGGLALWAPPSLALAACESRIERAKSAVGGDFADPSSAEFRAVVEKNGLICGQVNGRNRMGAYSGFEPFMAREVDGNFIVKVFQQGEGRGSWYETCGDGVPICQAKFIKSSFPVNQDGTPLDRCYPGLTPDADPICLEPRQADDTNLRPSQIHTNLAAGVQAVCFAGGYCYPKDDMRLSQACEDPSMVSQHLEN